MTLRFMLLAACLWTPQHNALAEQTITVSSGKFKTPVVELYTSEGCSSCPPADRWLSHLVETPKSELDVLALAFHVDYWDYIGWKDEFADPKYTLRQRQLADRNKQSTIYTPEFFVDGMEARGTGRIVEKVLQANKTPAPVSLRMRIQQSENDFSIQLDSDHAGENRLAVQFVVFEDELGNQVDRGENAGRYLSHQHVVRYLSRLLPLHKTLQHEIQRHPDWNRENLGIAALVTAQDGSYQQSVSTPLH